MFNNIVYITLTHFHVFIVSDDFRSESVIPDDGLVLDAREDDAALAASRARAGAAGAGAAGRRHRHRGASARRRARRRRARAWAACDHSN